MRIESIRVQNFRCFQDEIVTLNDYTCLVGANGTGKSTVLTALRVFFRDAPDLASLKEQDFCKANPSDGEEAIITVTFVDLDADAKGDFKHYVRQEKLIVSAVARWNAQTRSAEVKQYGQRMVMQAFAGFFSAFDDPKIKVTELRALYSQLRDSFKELPAVTSKQEMHDALRSYESAHSVLCQLEPSEDQFYGFTKGENRLKKHLEWAFIPAVKDAAEEQVEGKRTALGVLLDRTVRSKISFSDSLEAVRTDAQEKYAQILAEKQSVLADLSERLTKRIREWARPDAGLEVVWRDDPSRNVLIQEPQAEVTAIDGDLRLAISRMGHGLQRSFLLSLLQELSGCPDSGKPKVLLACEEPELYQHPPQARHLSRVIQNLSRSNAQVIVSSHSPLFVSGQGFPDVRLFRREALDNHPRVCLLTFEELSSTLKAAGGQDMPGPATTEYKIQQILQPRLNEMFFTPVLILVEGDEDLAFIETYLALSGRYDEFRSLGCHIVPTDGKGKMVYALAVATQLEIPTFVVFDADGDAKPENLPQHERDNVALQRLSGIAKPVAFPPDIFATQSVIVWPKRIGDSVRTDVGEEQWQRCAMTARDKLGLQDLDKSRKSTLFIGMVLTAYYEAGGRSKLLENVCDRIISFARQERSAATAQAASAVPAKTPQSDQPLNVADAPASPTNPAPN